MSLGVTSTNSARYKRIRVYEIAIRSRIECRIPEGLSGESFFLLFRLGGRKSVYRNRSNSRADIDSRALLSARRIEFFCKGRFTQCRFLRRCID